MKFGGIAHEKLITRLEDVSEYIPMSCNYLEHDYLSNNIPCAFLLVFVCETVERLHLSDYGRRRCAELRDES